jgi:uncharacterized membrane protein YiaA
MTTADEVVRRLPRWAWRPAIAWAALVCCWALHMTACWLIAEHQWSEKAYGYWLVVAVTALFMLCFYHATAVIACGGEPIESKTKGMG